MQRLTRYLTDGHLWFGLKIFRDVFFPRVRFIARALFRHDMQTLELLIRPPGRAFLEAKCRFREELIAIALQRLHVNHAYFHGPEASTTAFIAKVGIPI